MLSDKQIEAEEHRQRSRGIPTQKKPIRETLDIKLEQLTQSMDWTIANEVTPFMLPTAYNAPNQENIREEDDKLKIHIPPKGGNVAACTQLQLEEVVQGWMRYIQRVIKANKTAEYADDSPMTEYAMWQKAEAEYKSIYEQLKTPFVRSILGERRVINNIKNNEIQKC